MRIALILIVLVALAACVGLLTTQRWGGSCGYGQREYELTFMDSSGNPVEGIQLRVEDDRGNDFFCIPVSDYLPGHAPTSDERGVMRFHHVSTQVEWDNYGWVVFGVMVQATRSPVFICRFTHRGSEVYRIPYGQLPDWDWPGRYWNNVPKVKRRWDWLAMTPAEILPRSGESLEDYDSRLDRFFHIDTKGARDREAAIARRNACSRFFKFGPAMEPTPESVEDLEFPVIRRTITVPVDGHD